MDLTEICTLEIAGKHDLFVCYEINGNDARAR